MKKEKILKRPMASFVILSYVIFLVFFSLIGIGTMVGVPKIVTYVLQIISAWSSTFALIILFEKIYPGLKFKEFMKEKFAKKPKFSVLIIIISIQILIFAATIVLLSSTNNTFHITLPFTGASMIIYGFVDHLIRGSLGEELGWRGYMLSELQKKYSLLKSALMVGALWGFWHIPLWFVSGYTGVNLIKYCVFFMIAIISVSILMTYFYKVNENLLVPILIHQLFNFFSSNIKGEFLDALTYTSILYLVVAILLVVINPKEILYKKNNSKDGISYGTYNR